MKISELANLTGVSVRSLRHYDKKGLFPVSRLSNNYREFDESSVETVRTIQLYLSLGLTTSQIRGILYCEYPVMEEADKNKGEYCEELLHLYENKRNEIISHKKALDEAQLKLDMQIDLLTRNRDQLKG